MKKVTLLSLVLILLAVSVVPVMAAGGPNNGHGNGANSGQGNNGGNQDRTRDRDRTTTPSSSGNQSHTRMRTPFYLQGTTFAFSSTATEKTITVTLTHGNAQVKQYIGTNLTIKVPEGTPIYQITQMEDEDTTPNRILITFEQLIELGVGKKVAIHGNVVDGVFTARVITVYIKTPVTEGVTTEP